MRMMRKMWCDVMRSKDRWDWWMWWDETDEIYEFGPWVFVQGWPVVQQPGCGCTTLHPCSKPSSSRWPCGMSEEPLFAWWWWCLEFWNLMIWIWLSDIEKHYLCLLAHLKPIVPLFAANAQLCTHDVTLCRLLSRPSCPPLLRVPYGDALYNLMCARLRITAYALQTAGTAGRQNNLRARGGRHTHTPVLMRSVLAHHYWSLVHHFTFWSRNSNV